MSWEYADVRSLKSMATQGHTAQDCALELRKKLSEVKAMAELLEVAFGVAVELVWCDYCGNEVSRLDRITGWCIPCTTKKRIEEQRIADDEERARLEAQARREADAVKKQRERMREGFGVNPRKGR